ncbi:MAG TPA: biotin synthase BioB, partial [Pirellulales bacterium]|nr:biotin synthase BioB [Pirellulales bacterium]
MVGQIANDTTNHWGTLADRVLAGSPLTESEALSVLECDDDEMLDLLAGVYRVRRHYFGKTV